MDAMEAALWNANFEEGLKIARAAGAKDVWQLRTAMPAIHMRRCGDLSVDVVVSLMSLMPQSFAFRGADSCAG